MPRAARVAVVALFVALLAATVSQWRVGAGTAPGASPPAQAGAAAPGAGLLTCTAIAEHAPAAARPTPLAVVPRLIELNPEYPAESLRRLYCPADFNMDDRVDADDLAGFLRAFGARDASDLTALDLNADGLVDDRDLDEFLRAFNSGGCDPADKSAIRVLTC